jgi:hypothetical protein
MAIKHDSEGQILPAMQCPVTKLYQAEGSSITCDPCLPDNMEREEHTNIWRMREDTTASVVSEIKSEAALWTQGGNKTLTTLVAGTTSE